MPRKSTLKLSRRVVEALAVERGDRVFYDRDLTGFGVRVHASGRKVYVVHARAPGGALKRAAIGRKVDITVEDEVDAAAPPLEQLGVEMLLQGADAVADGGGGDAELLAGLHEVLVPGGGLEEAQAVERGQMEHGEGPEGARW